MDNLKNTIYVINISADKLANPIWWLEVDALKFDSYVNNNKKSIQIFEPLEQSIRYMDHYFYYKDEIKITLNQFLSSFKSKAEIEIALKQFYDSFDSYDELEIALKQCFNLKWRNF